MLWIPSVAFAKNHLILRDKYCRDCGKFQGSEDPVTPHVASALCYLLGFVSGIFFLNIEPYRNNFEVRFHAWQSILLTGPVFLLTVTMGGLPFFIAMVLAPLLGIVNIMLFCLWFLMMYKALRGRKLPVTVHWQNGA